MRKPTVQLDVSLAFILKLLGAALVVYCIILLRSLFMLLLISSLIAVTLEPVVIWLERHGCKRWVSTVLVALFMIGCIALVVGVVMPPLIDQLTGLSKNLPELQKELLRYPLAQKLIKPQSDQISNDLPQKLVAASGFAIEGASALVLLLITSLYLIVDGEKTYQWLVDFFPVRVRAKIHRTAGEVSKIIAAYVAGQVLTSVLVVLYSFAVLSLLKVPAALTLATLAGIFDVLPIVGFFLSTIPAFLLGLTVSVKTALLVFGLYVFYHFIENYWIVPKVYGNRLRLSTLSVLLALLAGGILGGVVGAIAILPIVASYPIIEKIWLREILGEPVIERHEQNGAQ